MGEEFECGMLNDVLVQGYFAEIFVEIRHTKLSRSADFALKACGIGTGISSREGMRMVLMDVLRIRSFYVLYHHRACPAIFVIGRLCGGKASMTAA